MPKNGLNVSLNSYDDIFSTEETRQEEQREQVQQIPIDELYPFKDHPFKVLDDEAMQRTVESIKQLGVTNPLIARPRPDGGYEIISGHRRQHAAQLARLKTLPVIVREKQSSAWCQPNAGSVGFGLCRSATTNCLSERRRGTAHRKQRGGRTKGGQGGKALAHDIFQLAESVIVGYAL